MGKPSGWLSVRLAATGVVIVALFALTHSREITMRATLWRLEQDADAVFELTEQPAGSAVRAAAEQFLGDLDDRQWAELLGRRRDAPAKWKQALEAIERFGSPRPLPFLIAEASGPYYPLSPRSRSGDCWGTWSSGPSRPRHPRETRAIKDVCIALLEREPDNAAKVLAEVLMYPDIPEQHASCAIQLVRGLPRAEYRRSVARRTVTSPIASVRDESWTILAADDPRFESRLLDVLQSADPDIRRSALDALPSLHGDPMFRQRDRLVGVLTDILKNADRRTLYASMRVLSRLGRPIPPETEHRLRALIGHADPQISSMADYALYRLEHPHQYRRCR